MHLNVEILEDARGGRSVRPTLQLHGAVAWPAGPPTSWPAMPPARLVDHEPRLPGGSTRSLANLDVLAPDGLSEEQLEASLTTLREDVSRASGEWIERGGVGVRFLLADRAAAEREAILDELLAAARARLGRRDRRTWLRVLRVELSDFRGIGQLVWVPSPNPTSVLAGVNGSGKTTLLDAMVLLLAHFEAGVRGASERPRDLTDDDVMNGRDTTTITITAEVGGNPVTWSLLHRRGGEGPLAGERQGLFSLDEEVACIRSELAGGDVCFPIAVHYPVNRAVLDIPLRIRTTHPFQPLEAYDGALARGSSNFRLFFEWFRDREDLENEARARSAEHRDHQLEAVRRAIASLMPGVSDLRVQRAPLRMVVTKGEWTLYVDQLSDWEKCLLAMAGDLARRLAMANPLADDPLKGGGVVLIDEIELHMHPGWQWRVLPALELAFPSCQIIVSTHSPAVLGYADHDSVFLLRSDANGVSMARPDVSKGMDVNRIYEDLLGAPARSPEFTSRLEEMHRLMDDGDAAGARALHAALAATLGADEPALVRADVLLRRREAARR